MSAGATTKPVQTSALSDVLTLAATMPSALVIEGEAGIGKTTLWLAGVEQARAQGFTVLMARPVAVESVLAYASLADLLTGVDPSAWATLPAPQRRAVDRIMSRADDDGSSSDQQAVAAGFLSVIEGLAQLGPVLVAIDDLQWLDTSSTRVIGFAARRLSGRVGVLATLRTEADVADGAAWLQLPRPDTIRRIGVPALSLGGLHTMIAERLGRSFSRPTLVRIMEISGGNPFYALELARVIDGPAMSGESALPNTLAELVQARIGGLGHDVKKVLLAAACLAAPTVEVVALATATDTVRVVDLLEQAEANGIIGIDGQRLRFAHPLLAHGVYTGAAAPRRRHMHRQLADVVAEPELRARHLALAATDADALTFEAIESAAKAARRRGAPAAAAELLDLAVGLGGDTPQQRIRLARDHFDAGETVRARAMLESIVAELAPGMLRTKALSVLAVVRLSNDTFPEALATLEMAMSEVGDNLGLRVHLSVTMAFAQALTGNLAAALVSAQDAVTNAVLLGYRDLLSQALGMKVVVQFIRGDGIDETSLRRALAMEDPDTDIPLAFRPSMDSALLLAWTGQLEQARTQMAIIRRCCSERGHEREMIFVDFHCILLEIWRGNFADATLLAEDTMERAQQLGGDFPRFVALTTRATLAAYAGRVDEARVDANEALAATRRFGSSAQAVSPIAALTFIAVSVGEYEAALTAVEPLLCHLAAAPDGTEINVASFVPDAVEALIQLGRLAEAEPLIDRLERNGARLDRAWMLAMGARGRAMLLAAQGEVEAANEAAQQAMTEHDRLPMPFERARTQLLLGQLQRRQKRKDAAAATMREALATFESLGTPLWAAKARAAIARSNVGPRTTPGLTPSEQRVAELAASGMTNRDVAAELFISPKTVEANLSRIYHKLGIRSRAELGKRMGQPNS